MSEGTKMIFKLKILPDPSKKNAWLFIRIFKNTKTILHLFYVTIIVSK
jgi:hypothetical protein